MLQIRQEFSQVFAGRRGLFSMIVFAIFWLIVLFYPVRYAAEAMSNPDISPYFSGVLDLLGLETLKNWNVKEMAVYWLFSLYLFPMFVLLISADQLISERARGGLRFLLLRTSRNEIYWSRFLAHLVIHTALILSTLLLCSMIVVINRPESWFDVITLLPIVLVNLIIVIAPFTAMMSFLSVVIDSVRMATFVAIVFLMFGSMLILGVSHYLPPLSFAVHLVPGSKVIEIANEIPQQALLFSLVPLLQTVFFAGLGSVLFKRQEV